MKHTTTLKKFIALALTCSALAATSFAADDPKAEDLVQYGSIHETIGRKDHKGRVDLSELLKRPHFYGIGALAGLEGEITILDSVPVVTTVSAKGKPEAIPEGEATLLVGQSAAAWKEVEITENIPHDRVDAAIRKLAAQNGIDTSRPFVFTIEGQCSDVRLHVINGACPMRARMKKETIPDGQEPFEFETESVKGIVVGVYAADSVGKLTHPATSQHSHLVYTDAATGQRVTGHLEQYGVARGATLKLPKISEQDGGGQPATRPESE